MIINTDSYNFLPAIRDKSFDLICIDPPYGMGIDTWDKPVDVRFYTEQVARIGREFYAVFGQMPYMRQWDREAERCGLHYMEHIVWVKRVSSMARLKKCHESIMIYGIGKNRKFYKTTGKYSDVKLPGILFDVYEIQTLNRAFSDLWCRIKRGYGIIDKGQSTTQNQFKRLGFNKKSKEFYKFDDTNFTNVWSFLPENFKKRDGKYRHPTEKPELVIMRLIEMLTGAGGSVLDFFSGSGTVAVAAKRLKRKCLCIEKDTGFYKASVQRVKNDMYQLTF